MAFRAQTNYVLRADVTLARWNGSSVSTEVYQLVNKILPPDNNVFEYWPILKTVSEITFASGQYFPTISVAALTINNDIGSMGRHRKFSDLLQRYTPVEQEVSLYYGVQNNGVQELPGSFTFLATVKCVSVDISYGDGSSEVTLNLASNSLKDFTLNCPVTPEVPGMSGVPDSSLGRWVPVIMGVDAPPVEPVRITPDGSTSPKWALSTTYTGYLTSDATACVKYTINPDGDWESISGGPTDRTGETSGGVYNLTTYAGVLHDIGDYGTSGVASGVRFTAQGSGVGAFVSGAQLTAVVVRFDYLTGQVLEEVAIGRTLLTAYDASNQAGTSSFNVDVSFDEPFFYSIADSSRYHYAIGWRANNAHTNDLRIHYSNTGSYRAFTLNAADSAGVSEWRVHTAAAPLRAKLHMVSYTITDTQVTGTNDGYNYSTIAITQPTAGSGQTNPHFDNFPLLIWIFNGLERIGPSTGIDEPTEYTDELYISYDTGLADWSPNGAWDILRYDDAYDDLLRNTTASNWRKVALTYQDEVRYSQMVVDTCRQASCRVGLLTNGKFFVYPWGYAYSVATHIPSDHIIPAAWEIKDISTVTNRLKLKIGRNLFSEGYRPILGEESFSVSHDFDPAVYGGVDILTEGSISLFGIREAEDLEYVQAINDGEAFDVDGSTIAKALLAQNPHPAEYVTFVTPNFEQYKDLEMFDTITFSHPEFPAEYGTNPDGREGVYEGASTAESSAWGGNEAVVAETYRGLIEQKSILLNNQHSPALRFTVRLLKNYPADPT